MWFKTLTGFSEQTPKQVRENLVLDDNTITSTVNHRKIVCGRLETPTLAELRTRTLGNSLEGRLTLREVVADVASLHMDPVNAGSLFQVASQFNLLEMTGPSVTPEMGIEIYENDHTQGPACAIAAGAGTIYRNYFAQVNGQTGQTADKQIDCLADIGNALGNTNGRLWVVKNGYAMASKKGLNEISKRIQSMNDSDRDALRERLRIGIQWDTQVTCGIYSRIGATSGGHLLTQTYCSALPVAYGSHRKTLWADFAQLVLEASYEATFCTALLNLAKTGNNKVYLTLLGGGAFGNLDEWIFAAVKRAVEIFKNMPLDVAIVSYGRSNRRVRDFIASR